VWFCRARRDQRRQTLRLRRGNPAIEVSYRTHWVSPELSEKKRERLAEKASHALELVVVQSLNAELICHRCGGAGDLLMIEAPGPACLRCVGLDDLAYPPTGDAPHAARESKKHPICCCRALQQDPSPLRTTRSAGRAAGLARCEVMRATSLSSATSIGRTAPIRVPTFGATETGPVRASRTIQSKTANLVQLRRPFSSSQVCDAKFHPYPVEAVIRYFTVAAIGIGRVVFKRFKPIDDFDATLRSPDRSAWRLIS
jgi:hypothetical protein